MYFKSKNTFTQCNFVPQILAPNLYLVSMAWKRRKQFEKASKMSSIVRRELGDKAYSHGVICSNNL